VSGSQAHQIPGRRLIVIGLIVTAIAVAVLIVSVLRYTADSDSQGSIVQPPGEGPAAVILAIAALIGALAGLVTAFTGMFKVLRKKR